MLQRIIYILKECTEVPSEKIVLESRLTEDFGFNSLDLLNAVIAFSIQKFLKQMFQSCAQSGMLQNIFSKKPEK